MTNENNILRETLPNGLLVMLKEVHSAPLISHWLWYRVGSRNELPGKTGISHWVEHMQFKGTKKYPAGTLDKAISRDGGVWNAFTYLDWTAYYETVPRDKVLLPLELEADRMCNSLYLVDEVQSERTVVISEREGSENDPMFLLSEAVEKAAFNHHPYGIEVIGESADLRSITRDDLFSHYRQYYAPNNAVLSMAGDFDAGKMLDTVSDLYRDIPAGEVSPAIPAPEGIIPQEKRIELEGPGDLVYMRLVWRAPEGRNREVFLLTALDSILSGPSNLNMFGGGGVSNKTSLLYAALVESQLAVGFSADYTATIDPYLYSMWVIVHPDHTPDEALQAIDRTIGRVCAGEINQKDLEKAVKQARAMLAYGSENVTNQAYWLGYSEMFANYDWFQGFVPSLQQVTIADISNYAKQYLRPENRVVGIFRPYQNGGRA